MFLKQSINNINKQITRIINRGAIYFLPLNKVIERYNSLPCYLTISYFPYI
nr:MAG TPA: hypothetical protein [Caudoviricetes sp.]